MRQAVATQALPHSEESERAVLGGVLMDNRALVRIEPRLRVEDFYLERHQLIYRAMLELSADGEPIDYRTLQARLEEARRFDQVGGVAYLAGMDLELPDLSRLPRYVEIVKRRSVFRQLCRAGHRLADSVMEARPNLPEILRAAEAAILRAGEESTEETGLWAVDALERTIDALEEMEDGLPGLSTGFADFDDLVGGLVPGELMFLAGRPSMGKTALALNMAASLASRGRFVAFFSLEMSQTTLMSRLVSAELSIELKRIRRRLLNERDWKAIYELLRRWSGDGDKGLIYVDDRSSVGLVDVRSVARRLRAEGRLDALFVDYIQLMLASGSYERRDLEIAGISRGLKILAKELEIPVVALAQVNRKSLDRPGRKPQLGDLRESGAQEQDADVVAAVHRDEVLDPDNEEHRGKAELLVLKARNGEIGTVELFFDGAHQRFRELDPWHKEAP